jgi:hypothetical protein
MNKPMPDPLPSTLHAKILPMTDAQRTRVAELTAKNWIVQTPPEDTFDGAMLIEAPDGLSHLIESDGTLSS